MKTWTALLTVVLAGAPAAAQTSVPLTLDEAVRRGIETSHRLAAATAAGDAASASAAVSRAARRPLVTAHAGAMRTNHVDPLALRLLDNQVQVIYPDIPDTYRTRVDVEWPVYTGGRLNAIERAARLEAEAVRGDRAAAESDLRLEITRAYWSYVTAIESLHVVTESEQRIQGHLQAVRARLEAGVVPRNDVLSVESQESRHRMLRIRRKPRAAWRRRPSRVSWDWPLERPSRRFRSSSRLRPAWAHARNSWSRPAASGPIARRSCSA